MLQPSLTTLPLFSGLHGGVVGTDMEWGGERGAGPGVDGTHWQPSPHHPAAPHLTLYSCLHLHCPHTGK